ncbi:hypothetical protein [Crenothrix sp.]|uniref:hypothetical protein n=1 Tax=Crenothrix sp. TaxID=3100433 RepID=UPI00374D1F96
MLNFKTLTLDKRADPSNLSSFVGIRRGLSNGLEFRLPRGFEQFPDDNFDATKKLFFRMYSTFKKFERDSTRDILDQYASGKDNIEKQNNGYSFKDKEENDVVLYSKIALIENLLEAYHDLALDVIERRIGTDEKVDYSKIDRYLHKAIYLPNNVIYIDEMDLARQTLQYESATLIDLFCFILSELQNELEQETDTRVQELAHRFSEQHLGYEQSLFNEETFEITLSTLKDILDDVDKHTTYKDDDYWRLYEAIETFLYGELDMECPREDGTFWGISNFSSIWEDMCSAYAFANFNDIAYADTNIVFNGCRVANTTSAGYYPIYKKENFTDSFFIEFRGNKRWMRPDLVRGISLDEKKNASDWIFNKAIEIIIKNNHGIAIDFDVKLIDKKQVKLYQLLCSNLKTAMTPGSKVIGENSFKCYRNSEVEKQKNKIKDMYRSQPKLPHGVLLLDWKYMDADCFIHFNKKVQVDITKQLCYELCLKKSQADTSIENHFVIPSFYAEPDELEDAIGNFMDNAILHSSLLANKIKVFKANFLEIQAAYLSHD